ncbi:hypothetical protein [Bradyrhizobium sp. Ec3.3]|uniref:hypothetical protein n=1 Tax=Bradyrhizobium sp. Ec3.3 TaxID=189753 RepID=UPI0004847469|nr:hypothetical protein [Bradyrhizobium sp. Ec3.3]
MSSRWPLTIRAFLQVGDPGTHSLVQAATNTGGEGHSSPLQKEPATGNYAVLRELGAPGFQVNTVERLAEIFAKQRNDHLDLGAFVAAWLGESNSGRAKPANIFEPRVEGRTGAPRRFR